MKTPFKITFPSFVCTVLCAAVQSFGQGTVTITFDGPPAQPPGTSQLVQQYEESGMMFTPIPSDDRFGRNGGGFALFPDNGTAYLQGGSLMCLFVDGSLFNLISVDLAGYSTVVPDGTIRFVGYQSGGASVIADFVLDGIVFQTVNFGPDFSNLMRVEISTEDAWSLDNLTVFQIPEPVTGALLVAGGFLLWAERRRR